MRLACVGTRRGQEGCDPGDKPPDTLNQQLHVARQVEPGISQRLPDQTLALCRASPLSLNACKAIPVKPDSPHHRLQFTLRTNQNAAQTGRVVAYCDAANAARHSSNWVFCTIETRFYLVYLYKLSHEMRAEATNQKAGCRVTRPVGVEFACFLGFRLPAWRRRPSPERRGCNSRRPE